MASGTQTACWEPEIRDKQLGVGGGYYPVIRPPLGAPWWRDFNYLAWQEVVGSSPTLMPIYLEFSRSPCVDFSLGPPYLDSTCVLEYLAAFNLHNTSHFAELSFG